MSSVSTRTALLAGAAAALVTSACASTRPEAARSRPMLASVAPTPAAPALDAGPREVSPARLLSRGFKRYERGDYAGAAVAFTAAIATGSLNDAGRALAYWQIALSERHRDREDRGLEALSSFVVVGEELLEVEGGSDPSPFVESFGLEEHLAEARAFISAAWARRVPEFGRSIDNSIPVHSDEEVEQFLGFAAPCAGAPDRRIERAAVRQEQRRLERITVSCASRRVREDYFVHHVARPSGLLTAPSRM